MSSDGNSDEVFDEEELADGFDEETIGEEDLEDVEDVDVEDVEDVEVEDVVDVDDVEEIEDEDVVPEVVVVEDDDVVDDADIELALDEVLAETIRRTSTPEDDEEAPGEIDTAGRPGRDDPAQAGRRVPLHVVPTTEEDESALGPSEDALS